MQIPSRAWGFVRAGLNGRFGVRVPDFGTGGTEDNPLLNDVDAGDEAAGVEFCPVFAAQEASGTLTGRTDGSLFFGGAADGTYVIPYTLPTFTPGDSAVVNRGSSSVTVTVGAASASLQVAPGVYAITGNDVWLTVVRQLAATAGAYAITGNVAGLNSARILTANAGAYSITGSDAQLTYNPVGSYTLSVTPGAYAITGSDVALTAASQLAVSAGSYAITGNTVTLTYGVMHILTVTPGAYAVTGYSATLNRTAVLGALAGAYAYTGRNVVLSYSGLADGAVDAVRLWSRVTPNVQLLAELSQSVRLASQLPASILLGSRIPD